MDKYMYDDTMMQRLIIMNEPHYAMNEDKNVEKRHWVISLPPLKQWKIHIDSRNLDSQHFWRCLLKLENNMCWLEGCYCVHFITFLSLFDGEITFIHDCAKKYDNEPTLWRGELWILHYENDLPTKPYFFLVFCIK